MEFDLGKFNLSELEYLTNEEFKSLYTIIKGEVRQLEIEMNRVTILIDLLNRKEELLNEVTEGHTRIRSYKDNMVVDPPDTVIISSRSDNITIEVEMFAVALKAIVVIVMELIILFGLSIFLLFIDFRTTVLFYH